jgi:hypothetical protein
VHGGLDHDTNVLVDQFAERDGLKLMHSGRLADTLSHGAFLRLPPWQAAFSRVMVLAGSSRSLWRALRASTTAGGRPHVGSRQLP